MPDSISFDRIADRYDATRNYPPDVATQLARGLLAHLSNPENPSLLEIGAGTGRITLPLLAAGANVTGVDISSRMLEQLNTKYIAMHEQNPAHTGGLLTTYEADATHLPFATATFDATVAAHVLHLIPDWPRAVDEALRVARPDGGLLLCQDIRSGEDAHIRMQDAWLDIIDELGFAAGPTGAANTRQVLDQLRRQGMEVREDIVATWTAWHVPHDTLRWIAGREWSRTWDIPERVFAESLDRLARWVAAEYGNALDTPYPATTSVRVAQIRRSRRQPE